MKTRGYAHRTDIAALPPLVWAALTRPTLLAKWMAPDARITPRVGGRFASSLAPGLSREALIDVFEEPRRLRLIYQCPRELPSFDGAVADDFLLDMEGDHTIVRLLASGIPESLEWEDHYRQLRAASERALLRLKVLAERPVMAAKRAAKVAKEKES
jgi:uncharacterized protein YndB with AHSA1/START domain